MNPLTNVRNLNKINQKELELGLSGSSVSWHSKYKDSAWIFVGGLPYDLTEGDVICVFSQYGEIVQINLIRDHKTGKSKGFGFICYEDQRSTILAVDNLNGMKLLSRTVRVDHAGDYKPPKEHGNENDEMLKLRAEGVAPRVEGGDVTSEEDDKPTVIKQEKKEHKKKKKKKLKKRHKSLDRSSLSSSSEHESSLDPKHMKVKADISIKSEKYDKGYDKYADLSSSQHRDRKRQVADVEYGQRDRHDKQERRRHDSDSDDDAKISLKDSKRHKYVSDKDNRREKLKDHDRCSKDNHSSGREYAQDERVRHRDRFYRDVDGDRERYHSDRDRSSRSHYQRDKNDRRY